MNPITLTNKYWLSMWIKTMLISHRRSQKALPAPYREPKICEVKELPLYDSAIYTVECEGCIRVFFPGGEKVFFTAPLEFQDLPVSALRLAFHLYLKGREDGSKDGQESIRMRFREVLGVL